MEYPKITQMPSRDINQLYPSVKTKMLLFLNECKKAGVILGVSQVFRTHEYQAELHKKLGKGASPSNMSMHEYRTAIDVYVNMKGKGIYDVPTLKKAGAIGKKLGLTWGGDFDSVDMPHFQYTGKYTQSQIRAGRIPE